MGAIFSRQDCAGAVATCGQGPPKFAFPFKLLATSADPELDFERAGPSLDYSSPRFWREGGGGMECYTLAEDTSQVKLGFTH